MRDNLTLNLGLTWEYTSPWVEKDDRQSNIDLTTGQLLLAGQNGNSRALYDAFYGGWEPRVGFAWTPTPDWVVRGAFGIVQYMEGTGKNLRLPANPPFIFEGQRTYDLTTGRGQRGGWLRRHRPQHHRRPGNALSHLRARSAAAAHEAVERLRRAQADQHAVGPNRLRRQPIGPHGRPVRLQPAGAGSGPGGDVAAAGRSGGRSTS